MRLALLVALGYVAATVWFALHDETGWALYTVALAGVALWLAVTEKQG